MLSAPVGQGTVLDKIELACLMQWKSIVKQNGESFLSRMAFTLPMVHIIWYLVQMSFGNQRMNNLDGTLKLTVHTELPYESTLSDCCKSSKLSSEYEV